MTDEEVKGLVLKALASVVPELDEATLSPDKNLRDQLDIDSMDFLNFVIALHEALKVDIPESDYAQFASVTGAVRYLGSKIKGANF